MVLRRFFAAPSYQNGYALRLGHREARAQFTYEGIVADAEALRQTWGVKGSSGNRICAMRRNVARAASGYAGGDGDYLARQSCSDYSRFDLETDEGLFRAADVVAAAARQTRNKGS